MATVTIKKYREQSAHFGLYRTSAGGSQSIFVRRKVGEPTDYEHNQSRKLKIQREYLTLASQHYAQLTPSQKAITRHQMEEIEYQKAHGKTDIKLLSGRQLFISKEMHSLKTTGKQVVLPYEICILLVDEDLIPLEGELWLRYLKNEEWLDLEKEELTLGNWLFSQTPAGQEAYRPYGEAVDYYDPEVPETRFMSENQILAYHYHILHSTLETICHSLPIGEVGISTGGGVKHTQPFTPCIDFELRKLIVSLQRWYDPLIPYPTQGFIGVYEADEVRKPIEPPLCYSTFYISLYDYPYWKPHGVTFTPTLLKADTPYVWVLGFEPPLAETTRINIEAGENGSCNLDPIIPTYISNFYLFYWQAWIPFWLPQLFYEMKKPQD